MLNNATINWVSGSLSLGQGLTLNSSVVEGVSGTVSVGTALTLNGTSYFGLSGGTVIAPSGVEGSGSISGWGVIDANVTGGEYVSSYNGTLFISGAVFLEAQRTSNLARRWSLAG